MNSSTTHSPGSRQGESALSGDEENYAALFNGVSVMAAAVSGPREKKPSFINALAANTLTAPTRVGSVASSSGEEEDNNDDE